MRPTSPTLALARLFLFAFTFFICAFCTAQTTVGKDTLPTKDSILNQKKIDPRVQGLIFIGDSIEKLIENGNYTYHKLNTLDNKKEKRNDLRNKILDDSLIAKASKDSFLANDKRSKIDSIAYVLDSLKFARDKAQLSRLDSVIASIAKTQKAIDAVLKLLIDSENASDEYSFDKLSNTSIGIIQSLTQINMLEMLLRNVEDIEVNDTLPKTGMSSVMQAKLKKGISLQMDIIAKQNFVWYNYATDKKQMICAVNINTANDLFTPVGISEFAGFRAYTNANFVQGNDDRDYTGGLQIAVATNYLKIRRLRPVKSYQTLYWGGDFYSPYFRDTAIFAHANSFNTKDRPFASFQYFGYATHCLSRNNGFRWDISFALGKVGGKRGKIIQTVLHQDLTSSPRPMGWEAQISNGGRLGFSLNYKPEYIFRPLSSDIINKATIEKGFYTSFTGDFMLGSFMTYASVGIQFSNKNFASTNADNAILRNRHTIKRTNGNPFPYLMWDLRISYRYVEHNAMLEGYGVFKTKDPDWNDSTVTRDPLTPNSVYFLYHDQVVRKVCTADLTISKQARFFTFFYRLSVISPETTFTKIGIIDKQTGVEYNLYGRWHHWATIGVCFRAY